MKHLNRLLNICSKSQLETVLKKLLASDLLKEKLKNRLNLSIVSNFRQFDLKKPKLMVYSGAPSFFLALTPQTIVNMW